jgi:hypothetical protein
MTHMPALIQDEIGAFVDNVLGSLIRLYQYFDQRLDGVGICLGRDRVA